MSIINEEYYIKNFKCKYCNNIIDNLKIQKGLKIFSYKNNLERYKIKCPICNKENYIICIDNLPDNVIVNNYFLSNKSTETEKEFKKRTIDTLKSRIKKEINTIQLSLNLSEKVKLKSIKELEEELKKLENNSERFLEKFIIER